MLTRRAHQILLAGRSAALVVYMLAVSEQTQSRRRSHYGGMIADEVRRLKEL